MSKNSKPHLAQILAPERAKLGPDNNFTTQWEYIYIHTDIFRCIYICIYIYAVVFENGPFLIFLFKMVRVMRSETVCVFPREASLFIVFLGFHSFCNYVVGVWNVGSPMRDLATWDFAEQKLLDLPLPLLAVDALGLLELPVLKHRYNECFWKGLLQSRLSSWQTRFPESQRPRSLLLSLGGAIQILAWVLPWARPGPIPGPRWSRPDSPCALFYSVSDPSRSRGGGHPDPSWSHPAPERSLQDQAWTGRNRLLGHFRQRGRFDNFPKSSVWVTQTVFGKICLFLCLSSASKCHFQSVLLGKTISCVPGSPLGTSLRARTKMTLVQWPHAQQYKVKTSVIFLKGPLEPPCGQWNSFSFVRRGPTEKWHPESDTWTR